MHELSLITDLLREIESVAREQAARRRGPPPAEVGLGLEPYWPARVPPNDAGIALGQAIVACTRLRENA